MQNYIDTAEIFQKAEEETNFKVDENKYNLCSMGRLCHQKGFDILIDRFSEVSKNRQDMQLYIIITPVFKLSQTNMGVVPLK